MNKNEMASLFHQAQKDGYKWNSDNSKLIHQNGGCIKPSDSGKSVTVGGSFYNTKRGALDSNNY